jgi:hypothetical protein
MMMNATKDIKKAREHVGGSGVAKMKREASRRIRRAERVRLAKMGSDYFPDHKKLTGWDIS